MDDEADGWGGLDLGSCRTRFGGGRTTDLGLIRALWVVALRNVVALLLRSAFSCTMRGLLCLALLNVWRSFVSLILDEDRHRLGTPSRLADHSSFSVRILDLTRNPCRSFGAYVVALVGAAPLPQMAFGRPFFHYLWIPRETLGLAHWSRQQRREDVALLLEGVALMFSDPCLMKFSGGWCKTSSKMWVLESAMYLLYGTVEARAGARLIHGYAMHT
jgi:hypothetical protein